jgi:hypothetical protein
VRDLLRDLVWPAVIATVLAAVAVVLAVLDPAHPTVPVVLGLASVTAALLATRS